jgi:hypothetical protein
MDIDFEIRSICLQKFGILAGTLEPNGGYDSKMKQISRRLQHSRAPDTFLFEFRNDDFE